MKIAAFFLLMLLSTAFTSCHYLTAAGIGSQGLPVKEAPDGLSSTKTALQDPIDHSVWTALLKKHVNEAGMVDYQGFKKDQKAIDAYAQKLSQAQPTEAWPVAELLAYYINLYNVYTVKLILEHHPVKSIQDISGAFTSAIIPVGDTEISLGGLENGILRKMNEPRIHFAINCASISCPKLAKTAYTSAKIDEELETAARTFVNSDKNDLAENNIKVSQIFKWYEKDFISEKTPTITAYINKYAETEIDPEASVSYKKYNWNLNVQD